MKQFVYIVLIIFSAHVFASAQENENKVSIKDSLEYELVIIDVHFDSWFAKNSKPKEFYNVDYYTLKNRRYVQSWNNLFAAGKHRDIVENSIEYNQTLEYGLDLEYKLYYYFLFIEQYHGVSLR